MDSINERKRAALNDLFTDAVKTRTLGDNSPSLLQSIVEGIISKLEKSEYTDLMKQASLDTLPADGENISGHKKDDPPSKEHIMPDHFSTGSSGQLSFVASHVTVNFRDRSNIIPAHSRPDAKTEQGMFQFTFTNASDLGNEFIFSPFHTIANLPWRVGVRSECSTRTYDSKRLSVYIDCNSECASTLWSCDAYIKIRLLSSGPTGNMFGKSICNEFKYRRSFVGIPLFFDWNQLMDPEKGYLNNDEATLEVQVNILKMVGFREFSEFVFRSDSPGSNSHVLLIVGGTRINVCKYYLSMYSPVFHAMFFSDFIERDKKEIILEDVEPNEFLELLHKIMFLLKLGDRFEVQFVISECERFLVTTEEVNTLKRLIYAEQYGLAKLQHICIKTIKSRAEVRALMKHSEYDQIASETKALILEQLVKYAV